MIERILRKELETLLGEYPIVTILGPRQSGKTTLARHYLTDFNYRNLELPDVREFADGDPRGFLADAGQPVILDEIQRAPKLLSYLTAQNARIRETPLPLAYRSVRRNITHQKRSCLHDMLT